MQSSLFSRRGEIWEANTGGKRHTVVVVSLDERNRSDKINSVLAVPFGGAGSEGPTVLKMQPGESGLPEPSYLKAHFISVVPKAELVNRLPRMPSNLQMKRLVAMINRAIDPEAPFEE